MPDGLPTAEGDSHAQGGPTSSRASIRDVAARAGVSAATVSRVLRGTTPVNSAKKTAVIEAARELGYIQDSVARHLSRRRSDIVGLLLRDPRNPTYGRLHGILQEITSAHGLQLVTVSPTHTEGGDHEVALLRKLVQLDAAGLLIATGTLPSGSLLPFISVLPTVVLGRPEADPLMNVVSYDEEGHAEIVVREALSRGHRDVAVVIPPSSVSIGENFRAVMMKRHFERAGVSPIMVASPTFGRSDETSPELVAMVRAGEVSMIAFPSDVRHVLFLEDAQRAGVEVPRDVSTASIDGFVLGSGLLGLSTVRVPIREVAERGIELLVSDLALGGGKGVVNELHRGVWEPGRTLVDLPGH